jgi:hypothetical protein
MCYFDTNVKKKGEARIFCNWNTMFILLGLGEFE